MKNVKILTEKEKVRNNINPYCNEDQLWRFPILPAEKSTYFDIWAKHGFQKDRRKGAIVKNQSQNKKSISI